MIILNLNSPGQSGFNARHSLGAMLITAHYVPLLIFNMTIIRESEWFSILPVFIGLSYLIGEKILV